MAYNNIYNKQLQDTLTKSLGFLDTGKNKALTKAGREGAINLKRIRKDLYRRTGGISGATTQAMAGANQRLAEALGMTGLKYDTAKANQQDAVNRFLSSMYNQNYNLGEQRKLSREQMRQQAQQFAQQLALKKQELEQQNKGSTLDTLAGIAGIGASLFGGPAAGGIISGGYKAGKTLGLW